MSAVDDLSVKLQDGKLNVRVAALIKHGNKVLLELGYNCQFYVLPGGRVKFGESAEDAVVREVKEELGVEIKVLHCLYVHQNFFPWNFNLDCHELGFYFLAEAPEELTEMDNFQNKDGKSSFCWMDISKVRDVEFFPICIKDNIENLPECTQLVTEHYDVKGNRSYVLSDIGSAQRAATYENVKASWKLAPVAAGVERWDLYDVNRKPLGKTMVRGAEQPENSFRLVVHVCIFNSEGKLLCQRRQPFKKSWANLWDVSVGGSVVAGETSLQGARREAAEELGVTLPKNMLPSLTVHFKGGFDDYYCVNMDVDPKNCTLQTEEVAEVAYFSPEEVAEMIDNGSFIPYNKGLVQTLFFLRNNRTSHTRSDV